MVTFFINIIDNNKHEYKQLSHVFLNLLGCVSFEVDEGEERGGNGRGREIFN